MDPLAARVLATTAVEVNVGQEEEAGAGVLSLTHGAPVLSQVQKGLGAVTFPKGTPVAKGE